MNTMKSVFSKIAEDKTELAKHEVNLANVKDISKKLKQLLDTQKKLDKINPQLETLQKQKKDSQGMMEMYIKESTSFLSEIERQIKDLGLDASAVPNLKSFQIELENSKGYLKN